MVYDVIIIGSGPAGLTAGLYTSRANLKTLVIAGSKWGGQLMLTTEVENYPGFPEGILGPELMVKMREQAERFGVEFVNEDAGWVDFQNQTKVVGSGLKDSENTKRYEGKTVIIATGADTIWLGLPNEQKLIGHGVSSCAPCDAFFFKDKKVIVVGGGDSAMEEALVLTKFASEVTIVHRRDSFRASKIMQNRVLNNPKIKIAYNQQVVDVLGEEKVTGVLLRSTVDSSQSTMDIDGMFVAIGHKPNTDIFTGQVTLDAKGYILRGSQVFGLPPHTAPTEAHEVGIANDHAFKSATSVPGVFVAGDVHDHHFRQAVTAAGYGCEAALEAERYLELELARA